MENVNTECSVHGKFCYSVTTVWPRLVFENRGNASVEKSDDTKIVLKNILKRSETVQNWNKINSQYPPCLLYTSRCV